MLFNGKKYSGNFTARIFRKLAEISLTVYVIYIYWDLLFFHCLDIRFCYGHMNYLKKHLNIWTFVDIWPGKPIQIQIQTGSELGAKLWFWCSVVVVADISKLNERHIISFLMHFIAFLVFFTFL